MMKLILWTILSIKTGLKTHQNFLIGKNISN
jgi:hypothetical protein